MTSGKDVSTKIRSLLDDALAPRLSMVGVRKEPNNHRIRTYTIFLLTSAVFLQLMSSQITQADLARYMGVLSVICFLWGAFRILSNESGFSSIRAALKNTRNRW